MVGIEAPVRQAVGQLTDELLFEPVNRVGGGMSLDVRIDPSGRYTNARCAADRYRGYETILRGRDVRDAIYIASRVCGYHGGQHAIAAAQAVEMALDVEVPPMAVALRNLGLCAEMVHAEAAHLILLAGPDFSRLLVGEHFPDLLAMAERAPAEHVELHGYPTIAEIMGSLDPITGRWYRDAFGVARIPYTMYAVMAGKYPHPETIVPGGVSKSMSHTTVTAVHDYVVRLLSLVDPAKRIAMMMVDLLDWLASVPGLDEIGAGPMNFIDSGMWDEPDTYDHTWEGLSGRSRTRWAAPGVVLDGQLVTGDLAEVAAGVEEDISHSFYDPEGGSGIRGAPYPAVTRTARPQPLSWNDKYSWSALARWKGHAVETGPGARLWTTALRGRMPRPNPFLASEGGAVQLLLPEGGQGGLPEMLIEWRPPAKWNAIERTRARLYGIVFAALVSAVQSLTVLDLQKLARHQESNDFHLPRRGQRAGVGFSGDGFNGHWLTLDGAIMSDYRVVGPSTFNIGPGGPAEAAINATPVLEANPTGVEALIALRSFDPCINCATQ
jgi:hydrogenase large subunit